MADSQFLDELSEFLKNSPTPWHAAANLAELLTAHGFQQLAEADTWELGPGHYFFLRDGGSLVAFSLDKVSAAATGFRMACGHTDSPGLQLKPRPLGKEHGYLRAGVEVYGSPLLPTWFDRDLALAGRLSWLDRKGCLHQRLVCSSRPVGSIPSLAVHLDSRANKERTINRQTDLPVVLASGLPEKIPDLPAWLATVFADQLPPASAMASCDQDLFFCDVQPPALLGPDQSLLAAARLDNLVSCLAIARALGRARTSSGNRIIFLLNHEEVGSLSRAGGRSDLALSVLQRLLPDKNQRQQALQRSYLISADNAHGVHPNFADRHDPRHRPVLNQGLVIKRNSDQRYATNSVSGAIFKALCREAGVDCQDFVMRSDMACGSTIGPMLAAATGVTTVDIGIPSLAMHSIRELAGCRDCEALATLLHHFFSRQQEIPLEPNV